MMENTNPDQWDPVRQGGLHGPHFSTAGWDQEFKVGKAPGLHPVEMLARIAKFEVRSQPILKISFSLLTKHDVKFSKLFTPIRPYFGQYVY